MNSEGKGSKKGKSHIFIFASARGSSEMLDKKERRKMNFKPMEQFQAHKHMKWETKKQRRETTRTTFLVHTFLLFSCSVVPDSLEPCDGSTPGFHTLNIYIHVSTASVKLEKLESLLRPESK